MLRTTFSCSPPQPALNRRPSASRSCNAASPSPAGSAFLPAPILPRSAPTSPIPPWPIFAAPASPLSACRCSPSSWRAAPNACPSGRSGPPAATRRSGRLIDAHPTTLATRDPGESGPHRPARLLAHPRPALRPLAPRLTFPELLNEPVFPNAPDQWAALQDTLLHAVRADLPDDTVVLTGNDWGSIGGLIALRPAADPNVVYSFHFYEPGGAHPRWPPTGRGLDRRGPCPSAASRRGNRPAICWPQALTPTPAASSASIARCIGAPPGSRTASLPPPLGAAATTPRMARRVRGLGGPCPARTHRMAAGGPPGPARQMVSAGRFGAMTTSWASSRVRPASARRWSRPSCGHSA